ncbi:MAG: hypothetical protein AAF587_29940 [Bacteroidota bacterium]
MKRFILLSGLFLYGTLAFSQSSYQASISELLHLQGIPDLIHEFSTKGLPPKGSLAEKMDQEYEDRLISTIMDTMKAMILAESIEIVAKRYSEKDIERAVLAEKSSGEEGYFLHMPSFLAGKIEEVGKAIQIKLNQEMFEGLIQEVHSTIQAERKEKFEREYKKCNQAKKGKFISDWVGESVIFDIRNDKILELNQKDKIERDLTWLSKCRFSLKEPEQNEADQTESIGDLVFNIYHCEKDSFRFLAKYELLEMIISGEMKRIE